MAQVSTRTLRHYDSIGLLEPAFVDPHSGYRFYSPEQLRRLHRILALRDLGVPLAEAGSLLDDDVSVEQLRGILRLRQAEARAEIAEQAAQLARVEARLTQLEETPMAPYEIILKRLDPVRVIALSEDLTDESQIPVAAGRLYPRLHAAFRAHGLPFDGLSFAFYEHTGNEERPMRLITALPVADAVTIDEDEIETIEMPAVERAATMVVRGAPTQFPAAFGALQEWIEQTGERKTIYEREVYIDCLGPQDTWVTELQAVLEPKP